jgi:type II secretion system protein N
MLTGSLILDGGLDIQGSLSDLSTLNGDIDLDIEDLKLDSFSVMGFQIPKLKASKGRIQLTLDSGKGKLKKLFIGKSVKDGEDDLVIESEGEFKLGKSIHTSSLNLELKLKLSKAVLTQMSLLEVALKSALTPEGAYLYTVSGPMASPQFTAGPKQGSSGK